MEKEMVVCGLVVAGLMGMLAYSRLTEPDRTNPITIEQTLRDLSK